MLGCSDGAVESYDLRNPSSSVTSYQQHKGQVTEVVVSLTGTLSTSMDGTVVRRKAGGECERLVIDRCPLWECSVDDKSQIMATGGQSGRLFLVPLSYVCLNSIHSLSTNTQLNHHESNSIVSFLSFCFLFHTMVTHIHTINTHIIGTTTIVTRITLQSTCH